ncbi:Proton/glutamate symporter family protein [[Clostridium] ultunense Esp]|uniref:Proton/glutamate symporter family protein n=1 Tax=[Clostridium] ultunense Esp TaxID=1288971 RepID=M1ZDF8_9FIRM|nr:dicarboxylate/amino acid:cation symporter [Schnuerera ultunensis]CCQ95948.1 Proton/glutamate symporter family protein [[Clostridium] ultunense Esp]SHD76840.1 Proton/glutamate symporter family protein [[Clostridium] ultunense Esp]
MSKKQRGSTTKIFMGLLIGLVVGILVYNLPAGTFKDDILIDGIFQLLGQVFLRGIMMMVVPLVFISLVNGAASMGDVKKLGRVGARTIAFYLVTTAFAVSLALVLGYLLKPGIGLDLGAIEQIETTVNEKTPLVQILFEMVPRNPISAMADGNMLQIIVFAIITGIGLSILGDKVKIILQIFEQLNELVMKMVGFVMLFAPLGVFGLIARTFATVGYAALVPLLKYIIAVYIGLILHAGLVYSGLLKGLTGLSPKKFYKKFFPAMSVAFSTASSNATVPINLDINEKQLGVSRNIAAFTIPLGATINMDGTAIMQGVATFFIAQVYNVPLSIGAILTVVLTATLASIGTAGVPGVGTIMLSMVLQSIGLPLEGIGLIMGIDRLVDMGRTTVNITGDAVCTVIIAKKEGELDEEVFNSDSKALSK